jgi:hypothetical protein
MTPLDPLLVTTLVKVISELARYHRSTVVFFSTPDQVLPKALKFYACMRLQIKDGVATVIKRVGTHFRV